jgi:cephalosporin hydroxylase
MESWEPHPDKVRGFSGAKWPQYQEEIQGFIRFLQEQGVKSYLEVGCRHGDTFHAVGKALPKGSLLVAVDLPGARSGKSTGGKCPNSDKWLQRAARNLKKHGQITHVIIGNSHDPTIISQVKELAPFDAIFIDGDHSPEGVQADWRDYGPMGTMIAFHDIHAETKGAASFYKELTQQYKHTEFAYYDRGGIGVIWQS